MLLGERNGPESRRGSVPRDRGLVVLSRDGEDQASYGTRECHEIADEHQILFHGYCSFLLECAIFDGTNTTKVSGFLEFR